MRDDTEGGIWADNVAALQAFLHVAGQWRIVAPGDGSVRRAGLDYAGVQAGLVLAGVAMTPELWAEVRLIEAGAVEAGLEGAAR